MDNVPTGNVSDVCVRSDGANQLDVIFGDARQRLSLKKLKYQITLPSLSVTRWGKLPSRREVLENDATFSREIRSLFIRLHAYKIHGGPSFTLQIEVCHLWTRMIKLLVLLTKELAQIEIETRTSNLIIWTWSHYLLLV